MSRTYNYPDGRSSFSVSGIQVDTVRQRHFHAAFCHAWDFAPPVLNLSERNAMKDQALAYYVALGSEFAWER